MDFTESYKPKTVLVAGATGATGRLLVQQLLERGHQVRAIVRSPEKLPEGIRTNKNLAMIRGSILELDDTELVEHIRGCHAVASCLGHNLTWKGIYGNPRLLVTEATRRLCQLIDKHQDETPCRFVLMNTTGNRNLDLREPISLGQKMVIGLLRLLLPPHVDNEKAADYLRVSIGQDHPNIQWAAVRPDNLVDQEVISEYELHLSPTRSAIFNAGKTSRINVAHFMADLITNDQIWNEWMGQMPVIYNATIYN